jgi:plastocyanin
MSTLPSSLRSGASLSLILAVALILPACASGGDGDAGGCPGSGDTVAVADGDVALCADDLVFDASTIEAPVGDEFTITFTNAESQPHNVAVYTEEGGEEIVIGDIITGPSVTNQVVVPALDPGTYYYRCDLHPEMEWTIVVEG